MFYNIVWFVFNIFYSIFFRLKAVGLDNIPATGSVIIAANHISLLDPPTVGVACRNRPVNFMAKVQLFEIPIFGFLIRKLGAFPVKRGLSDRNAIKIAFERLREGLIVGIFPEGTRSKTGKLGPAGPGVMTIASRNNSVVVPTAVYGTNKISWKNPFPKMIVAFGTPIYLSKDITDKEVLQQHTDEMMQEIERLLLTIKKD